MEEVVNDQVTQSTVLAVKLRATKKKKKPPRVQKGSDEEITLGRMYTLVTPVHETTLGQLISDKMSNGEKLENLVDKLKVEQQTDSHIQTPGNQHMMK